jgi:hypothetical protein
LEANPLNHPVYELLPVRTQKKLLSPVSEDKLTWDCFFGLYRAGRLRSALTKVLGLAEPVDQLPRLVLWGYDITSHGASEFEPLQDVLSDIENYRDGKSEGQKTEPDVIVLLGRTLILAECKRRHGLGRCSRFEDERCPEIHVARRQRPYCQYWNRGLTDLVTFAKPTPGSMAPECNNYYQLLRNYMIGERLSGVLKAQLLLMLIKASNSPHFEDTRNEVHAFNATTSRSSKYAVTCWNEFRQSQYDVLSAYSAELPPLK